MLRDIRVAFGFLTIVPVGVVSDRPGRSFAWFPLVGLALGAALALVAANPWLSADATAFVVLALWIVLTGGLHLDGFADACDALFATVTPARRLDILSDPRVGTWAVVGMVLLLLGKWIALRSATPLLLVLPPVLARAAMVLAAAHFPYARETGLGAYFRTGLGRPQVWIALSSAALIVAPFVVVFGPRPLVATAVALLVTLLTGAWAAQRLGGGLTGDIYGALCEVAEFAALAILGAS